MINVELVDKVIKISAQEKEYTFTNENGQIEIEKIISFSDEVSADLLAGEVKYNVKYPEAEEGLKLFIITLFAKLCERKKSVEEV